MHHKSIHNKKSAFKAYASKALSHLLLYVFQLNHSEIILPLENVLSLPSVRL